MRYLIVLTLFLYNLQAITVTKEYEYMASDSDSKNSAQKAALNIVTNMVIDFLGSGIVTEFKKQQKIVDNSFDKEINISVKNFASGFVQAKILEEKWNGEAYWLKANVTIDEQGIYEKLKKQYQDLENQVKREKIEKLISDISTKEKLQKFISLVISLPFEEESNINSHLNIINVFYRYKIYDDSYRAFLIKTLSNIKYPSWDNRTFPILKYLSKSKIYNEGEQKTLLNLLSYAKVGTSGRFLEFILVPSITSCDSKMTNFLSDYLELIEQKKAGLPVYTSLNTELQSFTNFLYSYNINKRCPLLGVESLEVVLKSSQLKSISSKVWLDILQKIVYAYTFKNNFEDQKYIELIKKLVPKITQSEKSKSLMKTLYKKASKSMQKQLDSFMSEYLENIFNTSRLYEDDIIFSIQRRITIPNKVFSLNEYYEKIVDKKQMKKRREYAKAILAYSDANKVNKAKQYIKVLESLDKQKDFYHADIILPVLENIDYDNRRAIKIVSKFISSENPNLSRKAKRYLLKTDNKERRVSLILEIIKMLDNKDAKRVIVFLHNFKQDAVIAIPVLKKLYKNTQDKELLYKIKWLEEKLKQKGYLK